MRGWAVVLVLGVGACGSPRDRACGPDQACAPQSGVSGMCLPSPVSGNDWCAYADVTCATGQRWGALAGDGLASACLDPDNLPDAGGPDAATNDATIDAALTDAGASDGGPDAGVPTCANIFGDRRTQVCLRWTCDRADRSEGTWSGAVASCMPGDVAVGRANALRMLNLYRFIAGQPPVVEDATRTQQAQACALMARANNKYGNFMSSDLCYSTDAASGAQRSLLSSLGPVGAVELFMFDVGDGTMGYRRHMLSNKLGPVGFGGTDMSTCLNVLAGSGSSSVPWVAWPPPGPVPADALVSGTMSVSLRGWTLQSDTINVSSASISVTDLASPTIPMPVTTSALVAGPGSMYAVKWVPSGWTTLAGHTYRVGVGGIAAPFSYDVEVIACP